MRFGDLTVDFNWLRFVSPYLRRVLYVDRFPDLLCIHEKASGSPSCTRV